jgi:hypothetical protein
MKRASKQAQSAVAKVDTYRKSKAAAPKSAPGGGNRPIPRRGDDRIVVGNPKPKGDKVAADRKKAVVEAGKAKAREKNAAKAAAEAAKKAPRSGPGPNTRPAPARPEQPRSPMKPSRPAEPNRPSAPPRSAPERTNTSRPAPQMGRPSAPPRRTPEPSPGRNPGMKGRY